MSIIGLIKTYLCSDCNIIRGDTFPCTVVISNGDGMADKSYCLATGEPNDAHFKEVTA